MRMAFQAFSAFSEQQALLRLNPKSRRRPLVLQLYFSEYGF
jgi:hypothetical protein